MNSEELIIIGAGATGLCASIIHAQKGTNILLLEQNGSVGKKIRVTGNGQCNISNKDIVHHHFHGNNPTFIKEVLQDYDYRVVEEFFTSIGLELVEGKDGKMFPMSLQASSVVELLEYEVRSLNVRITCECEIKSIVKENELFILETSQGRKSCRKLLIASGSPAAPQLGGNTSGLLLAKSMGHRLIPNHPALTQLCSDKKWVKVACGVKVAGSVKLYSNGKYITEKKGDILFTNYGISGLAILDISREVSLRLANHEQCEFSLDLMPKKSREKLVNLLLNRITKSSQKPLKLWLQGIVNKKLIPIIIEQSKSKAQIESELNRKEVVKLIYTIKNLKLPINDTKGFKGAEVSTGGIDTSEVNSHNMESKLIPNLFFGGEILDVDGDRGGFNLHFAWICGMRSLKNC